MQITHFICFTMVLLPDSPAPTMSSTAAVFSIHSAETAQIRSLFAQLLKGRATV